MMLLKSLALQQVVGTRGLSTRVQAVWGLDLFPIGSEFSKYEYSAKYPIYEYLGPERPSACSERVGVCWAVWPFWQGGARGWKFM